ncbi:MAG TPA: ankyrin repeat domain-containing protein [Micromonosporaceae bacterium]
MSDIFAAIDADDNATAIALLRNDPAIARAHGGSEGVTPVLHAMYQYKFDLARALAREAGALDLAEAAAIDDAAQVRERLIAGVEPDRRTSDGFTPLQLAAYFGAPTAAVELIAAGADVNAVADNPMRIQPLHAAAAGRHGDVAALLIDAGAAVNGKQRHGWTPLHSAAANGDETLVTRLLAAGADPAATNDDGHTAADVATEGEHHEVAARLR